MSEDQQDKKYKQYYLQINEELRKLQKQHESLKNDYSIVVGRLSDREQEKRLIQKNFDDFKRKCICQSQSVVERFNQERNSQNSVAVSSKIPDITLSDKGENVASSSNSHQLPMTGSTQFRVNNSGNKDKGKQNQSVMSLLTEKQRTKLDQFQYSQFCMISIDTNQVSQSSPKIKNDIANIHRRQQSQQLQKEFIVSANEEFQRSQRFNFSVFYDFDKQYKSVQSSLTFSKSEFESDSLKSSAHKQEINQNNKHRTMSALKSPQDSKKIDLSLNDSVESEKAGDSDLSRDDVDEQDGDDNYIESNRQRSITVCDTTKATISNLSRDMIPSRAIKYDSGQMKMSPLIEKLQEEDKDQEIFDGDTPFKMSQIAYTPRVQNDYQEELQKSLMGKSMRDLFELMNSNTDILKQGSVSNRDKVQNKPEKKLFEEFFIIGVDPRKLNYQLIRNELPVEPQTLYMLKDQMDSSCQRRKVVKDFCFPNGVQIQKLVSSEKARKILYGQSNHSRESCFVFTLQAEDMDKFDPDNEDIFFYCICLITEEIIEFVDRDGNPIQFISQKAYCLMSKFQYFEFFLTIFNAIQNCFKLERFNIFTSLLQDVSQSQSLNTLNNEVKAMMLLPLITQDIEILLNDVYQLKPIDGMYKLNTPVTNGQIQFTVPVDLIAQNKSEILWYSPMFLSCLSASQFLTILTALFLEKSIVFVSDNLTLLSSAVLSIQKFLYPLKWCHVSIPILPKSLIDLLDAPMPIVVGLLKTHFDQVPGIQDTLLNTDVDQGQEKLVVIFNDKKKGAQIIDKHVKIDVPDFKGILGDLAIEISRINNQPPYVYIPNQSQQEAILSIFHRIQQSLREYVLHNLNSAIFMKKKRNNNAKDLAEQIYRATDNQKDKKFLEQFKETQMFIHYLEKEYC